jgi:hypothetical protein
VDRYAPYVFAAFAISVLVLALYGLYLHSRLTSLKRAVEQAGANSTGREHTAP